MTIHSRAQLAYLTDPAPGVVLLNLQINGEFSRIELTQRQLANILVDGAAMAFRYSDIAEAAQ